jgi:gliding motility-associated-like protein
MKRIVTLLVFGLAFSTAAFAQPTINIVAPDGDPPCTNDAFCVDVEVADFTDILSTEYYIEWDSSVLQLTGTGAYNLPGLTGANFTQINAGRILLTWDFDDCNDPNSMGHTILADGTKIYEICFTAIGEFGDASQVYIPTTGDPDLNTPYIRRKSPSIFASCANIGINEAEVDTALIGTCLRPFIIDISEESANEGDLVCIDFRVNGFDDLTGFQFPVVWDSTKAVFESVNVPQNLPNFNANNIGDPSNPGVQEGSITVAWNAPPPTNITSVPDSTLIFQLCLRLKDGSCGMNFDVAIGDEQPGQMFFRPQASNDVMGGFPNIPVGQYSGGVSVGACNPTGVQVVANCGAPVNLNDNICVQVEAGSNFMDVTDLGFLMEWNPEILSYTGVQNINLLGLTYPGDFQEGNTANGVLGMQWDNIAQDRPEGTVLFEVCFDVIGLGGNSPFIFINNEDDVGVINNGGNIGINPTNCEVSINQPPGVVIDITGQLEGQPGDTLCFDFEATNFTDVLSSSFSIVWEPQNLEYQIVGGLQNINLTGASAANFNFLSYQNGQITFDWDNPMPVTLPDGTSLFTLCYIIPADGTPGTCDEVIISDQPLETEVITASSNGEDVGLTGTGGDYCILSPDGFYLEGLAVEGEIQDTVCLSYVVSDFEDITDASFCLNWNPGVIELIDIVDNGQIPGLVIDIMDSPVGSACFDFSAPGGLTLPDSANVFDMCFELLGPPDTCYTVEVSDTPQSTVGTLNGPGSLLNIDGEICINDRLFITVIDSLIVPESCPGAEDGCIQVLVSGGVGPYIYSWGTSPTQQTPKARFLGGGEIELIVIDQSGLSIRDTFFIPTLGGDLFANAGADRLSSCDPNLPCTLVNPMVSMGQDIVYTWTAIQGGAVCSSPNDRILLGAGPGTFIIEVRDTSIGCFTTDTIRLLEPFYPPIGIDTDTPDQITCSNLEVQLTAQFQSDTLLQTWSGPNGPISGPDINATSIMAQDSGLYFLVTEVVATQCRSIDSILVDIDTIPPVAIASPGTDTTFIGCDDTAMLEGFAGDDTENVSVRWLDANLNELTTDSIYETNLEGIYYFEVTNDLTGCTNIDSTFVVANEDLPVVNIQQDPPPAFDCNNDPIVLTTNVINVDPDAITVQWAAANGGSIQPGTENELSPTILTGGDYMVTVVSDANGCEVMQMITVGYDTIPPVINLNEPDTLTCINDNVELNANVTPVDGEYAYLWRSLDLGEVENCMGCDPAQINVGYADTYILTVTDTLSGCVAIDTFQVMQDTMPPVFSLDGFIQTLNCVRDTVTIVTSVQDLGAGEYTLNWMPQSGNPLPDPPTIVDDSIAIFTQPGVFLLEVTDLNNGCVRQDSLLREVEGIFDQPFIDFVDSNPSVDCNNPSVLLDASGSTQGDTTTAISYQWNVISGSAEGSLTNTTLTAEAGGVYEFTVTNEASGCVAVDTVFVSEDFEEPIAAVVANAISLVCTDNMGALDATGSSEGSEFLYIWKVIENGMVVDTFYMGPDVMVPINQGGLYCLEVYNTETGCRSDEEPKVDVLTDGDVPQIVFGTPTTPELGTYEITCDSPDTLQVNFFITNDTLFDFEDLNFTWGQNFVIENNNQIFSSLIPLDQIGTLDTLMLMVVDEGTGCMGENEFVIEDITNFPTSAPDLPSGFIGCNDNTVTLSAGNSSMGDTITYSWQNLDSLELGTGPTFEADTAGTYVLVVTNTNNNCSTYSTDIVVETNEEVPALVLDTIPSYDCNSTIEIISAADSGNPMDITPVWSNLSGPPVSIVGVPNTLTAEVSGPGMFSLQLTNNANGCDTLVMFEVPADTMPPNLSIATPNDLACAGQQVTLNTSIDSGVESVSWDGPGTVSPPNGLTVQVTEPGTYTLTVDPDNGCIATASVTVNLDPDGAPESELEADNDTLGCGDVITLIYPGTPNPDYIYEYITIEGEGTAVPAPDSLSATVDMAGSYILVLTDTISGCTDTSEVVLIEMIQLEEAALQVDSAGCGDFAIVTGNLPEGATGQWSSSGGLLFEDPTATTSGVSGFSNLGDTIVWTISYDGCPDYSSATTTITPELAPLAVDDQITLDLNQLSNSLNVTTNDQLGGVTAFVINEFEGPALGNITIDGNGELTYTLSTDLFLPGTDEFSYEICNKDCPDLCDIGFVTVEILRDSTFTVPNGITPNDDGMNDFFIFDQLFANPERYENNEFIVFNRWGDIVFEASPYNNDWGGTNMEGEALPDGTYYYILRLNIGDGEIIRGDVTIIR